MKYQKWLEEWQEHYVRIATKQRTAARYADLISNHIVPQIGNCEISEISAINLQKLVSQLLSCGNKKTGKGLSSSTVNSIVTVMQSSLSVAHGLGLILHNPASNIKRPKLTEKRVECFTILEQKQIEQAVFSDMRPIMFGIVLCLYTGLRIGELLALTWQDIDFTNGMLSVTKTCYDGKNAQGRFERIVDSPKTQSSSRVIPLPKKILLFLSEIKRKEQTEWVIVKKETPPSVRTYQRTFASLLQKLHIAHRGFHALRHTFATRAIECGIDVKTLSEILGHQNANITLNRYAHSLWEHKIDMMNKLSNLL